MDFMKNKELPFSVEAEQAVIGGLLLDNNAWDKISDKITESDFYRADHKLLFRSIHDLAVSNKPFDLVTLLDHLKVNGKLDSEFYLFELAKNTASAANISSYANIVRERSIMRKLINTTNEIADSVYHPQSRKFNEILDEAQTKIFAIGSDLNRGSGFLSINKLLSLSVDKIEKLYADDKSYTGTPTGFLDLDKITGGLHKGELIIVAGRPSMGKTSFAMNIAENVAKVSDKLTLVFSLEMSGESIATRLISSLSRIDQTKLRDGDLNDADWAVLAKAMTVMSNTKMHIDDTAALSPMEIRSRTRRIAKTEGEIGVIIIDYLQLMQVPGMKENRTAEISEITRSLKALAKEMDVPIIALSQLNRLLEQRADKRPIMSDLRDSGSIEQDADLILFVYRDEVYNKNSKDKGTAEIIISKHRNGEIGNIRLTFFNKLTKFENYAVKW